MLAVRAEGRAEPLLGVAVGGGDIEIIDPPGHGLGDVVGGVGGWGILHHNPAETNDRELVVGPAKTAARHGGGGLPRLEGFLGGEVRGIEHR